MPRRLIALAPLALAACGGFGGGMPAGVNFLDPGVRAGQERACAEAVAAERGLSPGAVTARRSSSDPRNQSIVAITAGPVAGYCRVTADFQVLDIVL